VELIVAGKELPAPDENSAAGMDVLLRRQNKKEKEAAADAGGVLGTPPAEPAGA